MGAGRGKSRRTASRAPTWKEADVSKLREEITTAREKLPVGEGTRFPAMIQEHVLPGMSVEILSDVYELDVNGNMIRDPNLNPGNKGEVQEVDYEGLIHVLWSDPKDLELGVFIDDDFRLLEEVEPPPIRLDNDDVRVISF